jgi:predicted nucleic acid-binding protein
MMVVDASVAIKWFVSETLSDEALALLDSGETFVAPELVCIEVTSGIVRKFLDGELSEKETRTALANFEAMVRLETLGTIPDRDFWEGAISLGFKVKHAFADCLYLSAAQTLDTVVITADDKMQKRGAKAGLVVVLLEEYVRTRRKEH